DLCSEGWMASHLESDVSPVGIHNVEGIVIDEDSLGFQVLDDALFGPPHFPHGRRRPCDQNHKQSTGGRIFIEMLFGYLVLPLIRTAVDDWNRVRFRITTHTPAKTSRHPHQVGIVQCSFRAMVQLAPPGSKTTRRITQTEVSV